MKGRYNPQVTAVVRNVQRMEPRAMVRKKSLRKRATKAELACKDILTQLRIGFTFQKLIFTESRYFVVDFLLRGYILEIDGAYHANRTEYDNKRTELIGDTKRYGGHQIVRFTNEQVFNGEFVEWLRTAYPKQFRRWGEPVLNN